MLVDLGFYDGSRVLCRGRWPYIPPPDMELRLELPDGPRIVRVISAQGQGMVRARDASTSRARGRAGAEGGDVPTVVCRETRVYVLDITDLSAVDSPGDIPPPPGPGRRRG